MWGLSGNERVDKLAKQAMARGLIDLHLPLSRVEIKCLIWLRIVGIWQDQWNRESIVYIFFFEFNSKVNHNADIRHKVRERTYAF